MVICSSYKDIVVRLRQVYSIQKWLLNYVLRVQSLISVVSEIVDRMMMFGVVSGRRQVRNVLLIVVKKVSDLVVLKDSSSLVMFMIMVYSSGSRVGKIKMLERVKLFESFEMLINVRIIRLMSSMKLIFCSDFNISQWVWVFCGLQFDYLMQRLVIGLRCSMIIKMLF